MRCSSLIIASLVLLAGCTFTLVGNAPKTEQAVAQKRTVNTTYVKSEPIINACENEDEQLAQVRFHTNPVYVLASVLSLGLYVPQNVTWWCGAEATPCEDGDESGDCEPYVREDG